MTATRKHFFGVFAALVVSTALAFAFDSGSAERAIAEQSANAGETFYYSELKASKMAQDFYNALTDMSESGFFKSGTGEYDLVEKGVLTQAQIAEYVDHSSPKIPVAFGAARDAFLMDHPDLFWLDMYKLYLSAGMKGGNYAAFIDSGRAANYYRDNTVSSAAEVDSAVARYNAVVDGIVADTIEASGDTVERIKFVNKKVAELTSYDYGAYEDASQGIAYTGYVGTAYGALVEHKALCGGYSNAFKAIMDRLDIPCVLVQGTSYSGKSSAGNDAGLQAHMWNAVQVDGHWYAMDVTWNDTAGSVEKYVLVGDEFISRDHFTDGVISSSGFELKYPAIRTFDYGVSADKNGFTYKDSGKIGDTAFGYTKINTDLSNELYNLNLGISYNGKNLRQLAEEGKYFAYRSELADGWSQWIGPYDFSEVTAAGDDEYFEQLIDSLIKNEYTVLWCGYDTKALQFAVFDCRADGGDKIHYTEDAVSSHLIAMSAAYNNDAYGKFIPAPYVKRVTPSNTGTHKSLDPMPITITYSEPLVTVDDGVPVTLEVTSSSADICDYISVDDLKWDAASNTLSFVFTPSRQFAHNCELYSFVPNNLVGKNSGKVPGAATMSFKRKSVVCSKVFNDGRLYMNLFGEPKFISASDESLSDFKDENGQPIAGNQRTQLMLVINEPTAAESSDMLDAAKDAFGLSDSDVKASSTYEIALHLCGCVQKVPKGSYMQIGFGFPDGIKPTDAGVTFTVYHYTRKPDGTIDEVQEVPCVVTECGIIATVKSFSPFMICAVPTSKASAGKNVYASVNGIGGRVHNSEKTVESKNEASYNLSEEIVTVAEGGSVSYTLSGDAGYTVDSVLLNGEDIKSKLSGDTLTLDYADLEKGNVLEVSFISEAVASRRAANGFTAVAPQITVDASDMISAYLPSPAPSVSPDDNTTVIVVSIVIAIALIAGACLVVLLTLKNKKNGAAKQSVSPSPDKNKDRTPASGESERNAPRSNTTAAPARNNVPPRSNTTAAPARNNVPPRSNNTTTSARNNVPPRNNTTTSARNNVPPRNNKTATSARNNVPPRANGAHDSARRPDGRSPKK